MLLHALVLCCVLVLNPANPHDILPSFKSECISNLLIQLSAVCVCVWVGLCMYKRERESPTVSLQGEQCCRE